MQALGKKLTPYIPCSCSLVFQEEADSGSPCRIHPGFTPTWFRQHMDLDYGIDWHTDPLTRRQSFVEMARVLNKVFPGLALGGIPEDAVGSISQIRTCTLMTTFFGLETDFSATTWPAHRPRTLSDSDLENLAVPDFINHPVYEDLMRQMDIIEHEWGAVTGELNYQGVLNTAFRLRGEELFIDMALAPEKAHHLLGIVRDTMLAFVDAVYERQTRTGVERNFFVTANCVVNMISGAQYREFVMPHDLRLAHHFPRFGIHNCAWRVDPYAPAYAEIGNLDYLDFGFDSDLAMLKELFPDTTLCAMYSPLALVRDDTATLRHSLRRLHDTLGRCRIIVADIEAGTPPERLMDLFQAAAQIWNLPLDALLPPVRNA